MPKFSNKSKMMLEECHPDLQKVLNEAIKYIDFTIVEGARTEEQQLKYYATGKSKTMNSKHLPEYVKEYKKEYSHAIDIVPYFSNPKQHIDWADREEFCVLAGFILGIAKMLKAKGEIKSEIRWGGKWSKERINENSFVDMPHFEIL